MRKGGPNFFLKLEQVFNLTFTSLVQQESDWNMTIQFSVQPVNQAAVQ